MAELKPGTLYGVGIGPGDPELLTLKAIRVLRDCPVIAAPRTASGEMLALDIARQAVDFGGKTILPMDLPMERDKARLRAAHEAAADQAEAYLRQGQDVAMLNLGDVSIYATFGYLQEILEQRGFATAMVPGVPSFCAVAARLNIGLTEMNKPLHIVPAGGGPLAETLDLPGTKILMKSGRQIPRVVETLRSHGCLNKAAMVQNCGLPDETVYRNLEDVPDSAGYFATIIVKE